MRMLVECERCSHRFIMRCPPGVGGLMRVACPQCREVMVLLVHEEERETAA
jgi:DNA-directed RNA polymerase subunit RPC12/RpoP